jgi:hypothetical protein
MRTDPIWVQVAKDGWTVGGRQPRKGELVQLTPVEAAQAYRQGWISLTRPGPAAIEAATIRHAAPPPVLGRALTADLPRGAEPETKRRRYRRRDLEAES